MDIQLNFIDNSNDQNNSQIVIFGKNVGTGAEEAHVAWTVIQNCGLGENHPFTYPEATHVAAGDSYGNYSPKMSAQPGQQLAMTRTASGDSLALAGPANNPTQIEIANHLQQGAISANIYKAGRLYATKSSVAPGQMAAFEFKPAIWIGAVSQIVQGEIMNSAIVEEVNTELSLLGIASADIVMTGGGPGQSSKPFQFTLENVIMA